MPLPLARGLTKTVETSVRLSYVLGRSQGAQSVLRRGLFSYTRQTCQGRMTLVTKRRNLFPVPKIQSCACYHTPHPEHTNATPSTQVPDNQGSPKEEELQEEGSTTLGKVEPEKMQLIYTCKVCQTRSVKVISKIGYTKGVVIVKCSGCNNNHLIADNLGWFSKEQGRRNVAAVLAGREDQVLEYSLDEGTLEILTTNTLETLKKF
ncbi:DNL-type zinc finger protein-like isoform X2 [Branchiostoma lanceolatum]|uniref:DNL-type zinc finger protein-like isoform X2 n=1 Tax=Branchiostoma lanceolatum TaxID=7740 RepID=UPI0034513BB3